jgi:hypothetical protein
VVQQRAQEPAPLPVQRAGSFGVLLMGMLSDPWPPGRLSVGLPAAQQVISAKDRGKSDSQIVRCSIRKKNGCHHIVAWREKFGPHATTQRRNEKLKKEINDRE